MKCILGTVLLALAISLTGAANIAFLMSSCPMEHKIWTDSLAKQLAVKGHIVHVVAAYRMSLDGKTENLKTIYLEGMDDMQPSTPITDGLWIKRMSTFWSVLNTQRNFMTNCRAVLDSKEGIRDLMNLQRANIDLIIYDEPSCLLPFAHMFPDVPIVALSGGKVTPQLLEMARGGTLMPSLVPHYLSDFPEQMSFFDRVHNMALYFFDTTVQSILVKPIVAAILTANPMVTEHKIPTQVETLKERIKIVLSNTHASIDYAQPLPPNVVEVAGIHIAENATQALPKSAIKFMDGAMRGCVYISLGSGVPYHDGELFNSMIDGMRRLANYRFLWELGTSRYQVFKPPINLYISSGLPQSEILGHSKTIAFITNANRLSMIEAAYFGVPVLALPREKDQINNAQRAAKHGMALIADTKNITNFQLMLTTFIEDTSSYKVAASRIQEAFRKRPQTPMATAIWYIEELLEDPKGFDHLVSTADAKLSVFQKYSLDIVAMCIALVAAFLLNVVFTAKALYSSYSKMKKPRKSAKKQITKYTKVKKT